MILAIMLAVVVVVLLMTGLWDLLSLRAHRRTLVAAVLRDDPLDPRSRLQRWDAVFVRTRVGRSIHDEMVLAGIGDRPSLVTAGAAVGSGLVVGWVLAVGLTPLLSVLGVVAMVLGLRAYLTSARTRRNEKFVAQMPELARVLSNATNAGLSIHAAVVVAAGELSEPAGPEMARVAQRLAYGDSLDVALDGLRARLPSREVAVLVSTLLVSARAGGSLVTALRDIADTLDQRKETRREIRTTLAQSTTTGYLVIVAGVGSLFLINLVKPGTVDLMLGSWVGRIALIIAGSLFTFGFLLIGRMTRYDG